MEQPPTILVRSIDWILYPLHPLKTWLCSTDWWPAFPLIDEDNLSKSRWICSFGDFLVPAVCTRFVFIEELGLHKVRTGPCRSPLHLCPFAGEEGLRNRMWLVCSVSHWGGFVTTTIPEGGPGSLSDPWATPTSLHASGPNSPATEGPRLNLFW